MGEQGRNANKEKFHFVNQKQIFEKALGEYYLFYLIISIYLDIVYLLFYTE